MVDVIVFNETSLSRVPRKRICSLVMEVLRDNKINSGQINVVFLNDTDIKIINNKYLKHNYATDVISFVINDTGDFLGEIYISLETAQKQADEFKVSFTNEVERLAIHGALHLVGYDDQTKTGKAEMTSLENQYLSKR